MPHLSIALLGPLVVSLDGSEITNFDYAKVRALLAFLAIEQEQAHQRDSLAELLWPEQAPHIGRNSLRQALATLRRAIHDAEATPPFLLVTRDAIQFNKASDHALDTATIAELLATCERHQHISAGTCRACASRWEQVAALYRGPFGVGTLPRASQQFEEWLIVRREWFEQQVLAALAQLAIYHEQRGNWGAALAAARQMLAIDPWQEQPQRQAMRLLNALGQREAALAQYEQCRRALAAELGSEPEPETMALAEQIRAGTLRAATFGTTKPSNLPSPPARLIGREAELHELSEMLAEPSCRLITLLGPGGIGKTRLALELASTSAEQFRDGVFWVALGSLTSADFMAETIARAIEPALAETDDPRAALLAFLHTRQALLVLDNIEHVLPNIDIVIDILVQAPQLTLIITSRERLQLQREWLYEVRGLPFPSHNGDPDDMPAIRLLLERARQVRRVEPLSATEQHAAQRIARLVEGMPLALELAAAASHQRSFAEIAEGIAQSLDLLAVNYRDMTERHRSIRAAFTHSWQLLHATEQAMLARLSVFRGGFEADAASAIAGANEQTLQSFIDRSLLRQSNQRYELHELIRQFSAEQLHAFEQADSAYYAHLDYLVALAEQAETQLLGAEQQHWLARLEQEHDNIRAALGWGLAHKHDFNSALATARLAGALWRFWWMRSHTSEARRWLDQAFAALGGEELLAQGSLVSASPALRPQLAALAKVAKGAANLANEQSDYASARARYALAIELEQALGNRRGLANNLSNMALAVINQGDLQYARELLERSVEICEEIGHETGILIARDGLAEIAMTSGDYATAQTLYDQSLTQHTARGDTHSAAIAQHNLNDIARAVGDYATAMEGAQTTLRQFRELGNDLGAAASLHVLGVSARALGDWNAAQSYHTEALQLASRTGNRLNIAICLIGLAALADARSDMVQATQLAGAAEMIRATIQGNLLLADKHLYEQIIEHTRSMLGEQRWQIEWLRGQALSIEQAVERAAS